MQAGRVLKEKAAANIFIERNLHEDFCRDGKQPEIYPPPPHLLIFPSPLLSVPLYVSIPSPFLSPPTSQYPPVPDIRIEGTLTAIHAMLDKGQLEVIKGLIDMNLGEQIEDFEKPSSVIRDPIAQVSI